MACVRKNRSFYFDHGTGDYITLELTQSKLNSPKRIIINQLYILLGLPGFGFKRRVMSPYYLSKYQEFIDLESYLPGPSLNLAFKSLFDAVNSYMNKTLVLPRSPEHVAYEMPTYDPEYDVANLELITKNCQKDELLIIKYHRSLYSKGDFHETLVPRCRALGFTAINLDQYITNILKGNVPAELAVKMLGVNKILSSGSSTTFNLSHNPDLIFVTDVEPYEKMPHEENANAHYADAFMLDKIRRGSLYLSS
jgi:hypothetical protein